MRAIGGTCHEKSAGVHPSRAKVVKGECCKWGGKVA